MDAQARALLKAPNFCHVATLNDDGTPYTVLVWVDVEGDEVVLNTEEKRRWRRNVARDPRVSLLIADQQNPYTYVRVEGRVCGDDNSQAAWDHIDAMAQKYIGQDRYPFHSEGDERVILRIAPDRVKVASAG
jgi:PPOX class probable F420-dependent enzyme